MSQYQMKHMTPVYAFQVGCFCSWNHWRIFEQYIGGCVGYVNEGFRLNKYIMTANDDVCNIGCVKENCQLNKYITTAKDICNVWSQCVHYYCLTLFTTTFTVFRESEYLLGGRDLPWWRNVSKCDSGCILVTFSACTLCRIILMDLMHICWSQMGEV